MSEVATALEEMIVRKRGRGLVPVSVVSIDEGAFVFDAKDGAGNEYLDVRMNATTGLSGIVALPKPGSSVIITDLGNQEQAWVMVAAGTLEKVYLVGDGAQVQGAVKGEDLNANLTQLLNALDSLINALTAFSTSNGAASAGVLTPLAPAYSALNAALPSVASSLSTVRNQLSDHLSETISLT